MESNQQVIIIGGGVIGLACAHYLTERGVTVRIIEKERVGSGASHGNCGLLFFSEIMPLCSPGAISHEMIRTLMGNSPLYIKPTLDIKRIVWLLKFAAKCRVGHKRRASRARYELLRYSQTLYETLLAGDALACDFEKQGILSVFKEKKNFEGYGETSRFLEGYKLGMEKIDKEALAELEPALSGDVAGAWLSKGDWHLRPDMLLASWKAYLEQQGVIFEEQCRLTSFDIKGQSVTGVNTEKGRFHADAFVLATGAWSPGIFEQLRVNLPVEPGKGYSITMERPGICPTFPCYLYEKNMVVTPWKSGYRLGGTMEFSGFDDSLNEKRLNRLITGAGDYLKDPLGHPVHEQWTSFRPMVYDDLPIIDRAPFQDNLVIATGHGMMGLTMATGTGKVISDLAFGRKSEINVRPFSIRRFG